MKKITYIFTLIFCALIASCSDDENGMSALKVTNSDVTFEATGGTGVIQVEAIDPIEATSNKEWCTVSTEGNTIRVAVSGNVDLLGRTALVTITSGESKTMIAVAQNGVTEKSETGHTFSYEGGSVSLPLSSLEDCTVMIPAEAQSWLSYKIDEGSKAITFTAAANTEKTPIGTTIKILYEKRNLIIYHIGEYELKDIAGTWNISFKDKDGNTLSGEIPITEAAPSIFFINGISSYFQGIPVIFENGSLRVIAGLKLGTALKYNIYTVMLTRAGYWSPEGEYEAYPTTINGKFSLVFGDNGSIEDDMVNSFALYAFPGDLESTPAGYIEIFSNMILSK